MNDDRKGWAEDSKVTDRLYYILIAVCVLLVVIGLMVPGEGHHFRWESWFGFYAIFGFISYAFIVFAGKAVRKLLMRDEDYYDR